MMTLASISIACMWCVVGAAIPGSSSNAQDLCDYSGDAAVEALIACVATVVMLYKSRRPSTKRVAPAMIPSQN
jgi:hypothetical protein